MANQASFCHVFLSFRGETRNNFTCFLYEALKAEGFVVFMDKSDIRVGDEVDRTIQEGIKTSMSSIIVFSQNYAYSTWCLDELVLILERKKNSGYFIIPIFYEVQHRDIKHQLGNYGLALEKHRARHSDKVEKWRKALTEVGNILGDHVEGLHNIFIQKTVKQFREKLAANFPEYHLPTSKSSIPQDTPSSSSTRREPISRYAPDENLPISDTSYQIFPSRQEAYDKLWNALVNKDGYPIIGIYGMAGAGKTRMMEQAWTELKEKKIFDKVARANVGGEELDVIKLQDQLSGYLNCHLEPKDNEIRRAFQLKHSLMAGGQKILVILDDVWADIPLPKIGIPFGDGSSKGCKILLTSRMKNVCLGNNCTDPIEIKILSDDEAWEMFSNTVGTSKIDSLEDRSLAENVCDECGGLPLLINAVGRALKFLTEKSWNNALNQLKDCKYKGFIDRIDQKLYIGIKISFNVLEEGEKACLLLCSFFREDADIDIKMLFDMARGSELLDSRMNIDGLIDNLKSSSLLLEGRDVDKVKVHDIIRDVARSIATTDYAFLSLRCEESCLPNAEYRSRRLLRLDLEEENVEFPDDLDCPELHTLWLQSYNHSQQQLSSVFFNAFVNLKVLLLEGQFLFDQQLTIHNLGKLRVLILDRCKISQTFLSSVSRNLETLCIRRCRLPSPLDLPELKNLRKLELVGMGEFLFDQQLTIHNLGKLRVLILDDCKISQTFLSSVSRNLETLCIRECDLPSPLDLPELKNLRKLELVDSDEIEIVEEAISRLSRLQELIVPKGFKSRVDDDDAYIYRELSQLGCLRNLVIWLKKLPDTDIFGSLVEFNIHVADSRNYYRDEKRKKYVECRGIYVERWVMPLLERAEQLHLWSITGLPINGFSDSNMEIAFAKLKEMTIERCKESEHVASWEGRNQRLTCFSFTNLTSLKINDCNRLKYVFSDSVAKCLLQLQTLEVKWCSKIEEIIRVEDSTNHDGEEIICFPNLQTLFLWHLHSLTCFCKKKKDSLFDGSLTFNTLKKLYVVNCGVSTLFTSSAFTILQHLEWLEVSDCCLLKEIVEAGEDARDDGTNENKTTISLLHLESITLSKLPNLQNIGISACYMPALDWVEVTECGMITSLFTRSAFTNLQHLRELKVSKCHLLEEIVEDEMDDVTPGVSEKMISLPLLRDIRLEDLPSLTSFYGKKVTFPDLRELHTLKLNSIDWLEEIELGPSKLRKLLISCETKQLLPSQLKLHLQNLQEMRLENCCWAGQDSLFDGSLTFNTLKELKVVECSVSTLFTSSVFRSLHQLERLYVSHCSLLKDIVEAGEDARGDGTDEKNKTPISLPHLQSITLLKLPNLQNIGISACYMPALVTVGVYECGLITSLFTRSAFINLQHLRELKVSDCSLLKEIVEDEMDDVTPGVSEKMISLPLLTIIKLENLPKVRSFSSSTNFTFDIPALGDLSPSNCPEWRYPHPITAPALTMLRDNNQEIIDESQGQEEDEE